MRTERGGYRRDPTDDAALRSAGVRRYASRPSPPGQTLPFVHSKIPVFLVNQFS